MFNPIKKNDDAAVNSLNRLSSLKHGDESAKKEAKPSSQPNKSSASFSKALNAVRQEVEDTQSGNNPVVNKPSKSISFGEAINARREKVVNPFLKLNPQFQKDAERKAKAE